MGWREDTGSGVEQAPKQLEWNGNVVKVSTKPSRQGIHSVERRNTHIERGTKGNEKEMQSNRGTAKAAV